jgi:UDPglucose--hexose-1-phosphate uridylyltransferase
MSEYRQDVTTGTWVIVAPERGRRPRLWQHGGGVPAEAIPAHDPDCPFCPGNEHLLPEIIEETASDAPPGWAVRVLPNKFPAVSPAAELMPMAEGIGQVRAGYGFHEVVVESSRHDADLAEISERDLQAVVQSYRHRYNAHLANPDVGATLLFRNHGRKAGASLVHPHSQIIAVAVMPPRLTAVRDWMRMQHERRGCCVTCKMLEAELALGTRVVAQTEGFVVLVPFAAASPLEMWLLPRRHQASFGRMDDAELREFAVLLQGSLRRLRAVLDDPPYNFVVESWDAAQEDFGHWRLRIVPDLTTPGGFELGSGLAINPSRPEDDAEVLRAEARAAGGR